MSPLITVAELLDAHGQQAVLGVAGVRAAVYAGSWSGWITDPDRPVERG